MPRDIQTRHTMDPTHESLSPWCMDDQSDQKHAEEACQDVSDGICIWKTKAQQRQTT